jgi:signal peptidase II
MENKKYFFDRRFGFVPYLNKDQLSIFNNEMNLNLSLFTLILINIASIIIIAYLYNYIKKREYTNSLFENAFIMLTAGVVCSFIDKITLGGSLDYILFFKHIHDLKDFYLYIGFILIIIYMITNLIHEKRSKGN